MMDMKQYRMAGRRTAADVAHLERKLDEARDHATILGRSATYWMHDARRAMRLGQTSVAFTSVLLALQDRILAREWRDEVRFIRQRIREVTS
jgi:hypothetical protein